MPKEMKEKNNNKFKIKKTLQEKEKKQRVEKTQ